MPDRKHSSWYQVHTNDQFVWIHLNGPCRVLSSSVLNGGLIQAEHILNLKVPRQLDVAESPTHTLQTFADRLGAGGTTVGMMTAASMDSYRFHRHVEQGVELAVLVTCGLDNARRVGDPAEFRQMTASAAEAGTINIIFLTSATMSSAAMVEAVQMITEAKTAALMAADIRSPLTASLATGTGTDAVAVVSKGSSDTGDEMVNFCGKHVLFGEILGRLVLDAVQDSIRWYQDEGTHSDVDT